MVMSVMSRIRKPDDPEHHGQEKLTESEQIVTMVNRAVTAMTSRLNSLAEIDGVESKVSVYQFVAC